MPRYLDGSGLVILHDLAGIQTIIEPGHRLWDEVSARGDIEPFAPPAPTADDYRGAVQAHVDAVARGRGYDGGHACATYAASTVPLWAAEGAVFVAWRDAVWVAVLARMESVAAGHEAAPNIADLIADLPLISWP